MVTFPSTLLGLSKSKYVAQGSPTISQDMGTSLSIKWTSQPLAHTLYSSHVSHAMTGLGLELKMLPFFWRPT